MAGVSQEMPASVTQHMRVHMRQSRTINGVRQVIYAKAELSLRDQLDAASKLTREQ
jgi:hypothetical protein